MISNISSLIRRRDLLRELVISELRSSVAGSRLGWIWWFADPLLMMLIYWGIMVGLFGRGTARYSPYPVFIFCALISWKHFSTAVTRALGILQARERLIKSIPFPTMVLPLSVVFSGFAHFLFGFAILLASASVWPNPNHTGALLPLVQIPLLMLLQLAFTAGVCLAISSFGVLLNDLSLFTTHILRAGFYLSPGLYGVDLVAGKLGALPMPWSKVLYLAYMANPFAVIISGYRASVLFGTWIPPGWWACLAVETFAVLFVGYRVFQYYDRRVIKFL